VVSGYPPFVDSNQAAMPWGRSRSRQGLPLLREAWVLRRSQAVGFQSPSRYIGDRAAIDSADRAFRPFREVIGCT
jgi:hypothetical protein